MDEPKARQHLHSKPELMVVRRHLRQVQTPAERFLWQRLRNRQLHGRKFKRQYSVGRFVLDFYCAEEKLAIELDGSIHDGPGQLVYDDERSQALQDLGIRVVRFKNRDVFERLETVLDAIVFDFTRPI